MTVTLCCWHICFSWLCYCKRYLRPVSLTLKKWKWWKSLCVKKKSQLQLSNILKTLSSFPENRGLIEGLSLWDRLLVVCAKFQPQPFCWSSNPLSSDKVNAVNVQRYLDFTVKTNSRYDTYLHTCFDFIFGALELRIIKSTLNERNKKIIGLLNNL